MPLPMRSYAPSPVPLVVVRDGPWLRFGRRIVASDFQCVLQVLESDLTALVPHEQYGSTRTWAWLKGCPEPVPCDADIDELHEALGQLSPPLRLGALTDPVQAPRASLLAAVHELTDQRDGCSEAVDDFEKQVDEALARERQLRRAVDDAHTTIAELRAELALARKQL